MELGCEYCLNIINLSAHFCHECTYKRIIIPIKIPIKIPELPFKLKDRVHNKKYMFNGKIVICNGGVLNCIHGIRRTKCNDINCIEPSNYCIHELPKKNCSKCILENT